MFLLQSYFRTITEHYSIDEQNQLLQKLIQVSKDINSEEKIKKFILSFVVSKEKKIIFIENLFITYEIKDKYFFKIVALFIKNSQYENLLDFLSGLIKELEKTVNKQTVKIYSSSKLNNTQKEKIENHFNNKHKNIFFQYFIKPEIILGIKIIFQNQIFDSSLEKQFSRFNNWFKQQK